MRNRVIIWAVLVLLVGCQIGSMSNRKVSGDEARRLVASGALLVDVRTPAEFSAGHIKGAVNIPLLELEQRMGELGAKDKPIVLYCRSGNRSSRAQSLLEKAGFSQVYDLGAMSSW